LLNHSTSRENMMNRYTTSMALAALLIVVIACNASGAATMTPQLAVSATPLPATTIPSTQLGPTAVPPTPAVSAPTQSEPERVVFETGGTSATLQGKVAENSSTTYILGAIKDQTMTVEVAAIGGRVGLTVVSPGGVPLVRSSTGQTRWSDKLPESGDYTIQVVWLEGGSATYTLTITIPPLAGSGSGECLVTNKETLTAYRESSPIAEVFGTADAGMTVMALARTKDGWLGFDPGVAQAGNVGRARLRWYLPDWSTLTFEPAGCENGLPYLLSYASIANGTYNVLDVHNITLTNGRYANSTFDPADTGSSVHDTFMGVVAFGDMNADGAEDAVVALFTNTGGTGTFVELALVVNVDGQPQHVASTFIDDRAAVHTMSIADGILTADLTIHGAGDGGCCPTLKATWQFKFQSGKLAKLGD
jgi:hypothetical protein